MKKLIVLILVLILSFVGFKYWKNSNKLNSPQIQTSMNKSAFDNNNVSKSKEELPCFDAAIGFLGLTETIKQGAIMCGQQKRFELYFDSPLMKATYEISMKCMIKEAIKEGVAVADAENFSVRYISENISKLNAADKNKNKTSICSSNNAIFTRHGF